MSLGIRKNREVLTLRREAEQFVRSLGRDDRAFADYAQGVLDTLRWLQKNGTASPVIPTPQHEGQSLEVSA